MEARPRSWWSAPCSQRSWSVPRSHGVGGSVVRSGGSPAGNADQLGPWPTILAAELVVALVVNGDVWLGAWLLDGADGGPLRNGQPDRSPDRHPDDPGRRGPRSGDRLVDPEPGPRPSRAADPSRCHRCAAGGGRSHRARCGGRSRLAADHARARLRRSPHVAGGSLGRRSGGGDARLGPGRPRFRRPSPVGRGGGDRMAGRDRPGGCTGCVARRRRGPGRGGGDIDRGALCGAGNHGLGHDRDLGSPSPLAAGSFVAPPRSTVLPIDSGIAPPSRRPAADRDRPGLAGGSGPLADREHRRSADRHSGA